MSCEGWKECRLDEFVKLQRGHDLPRTKMEDGEIQVAGSNGVIGYHNKATTKGPGITVGRSGNVGNVYYYKKDFWPHNTTLYSKEFINSDPRFVYYFLKTLNLGNYGYGSAVPTLNRNHIHPIRIFVPESKEEQRSIARILSSFDDKIELNNRMNKTLEEIAQTLFKRWFVDFEFPDENGDPYKSSGGKMVESELGLIPEGWVVCKLGDLVNCINGYSYKGTDLGESPDALVTIKNFDRKGGFQLNGFKKLVVSNRVKDRHYTETYDLLVAHTDITQAADIIGNPILVMSKLGYRKLVFSMDLVKVKPLNHAVSSFFLYYLMSDQRFKDHVLSYASGSTVLHLKKTAIPEYSLTLPLDNKLTKGFAVLISSLVEKQSNNIQSNTRLTQLRDSLIPKLMSGEVKVQKEVI